MSGPKGDARSSTAESGATKSRRGMDGSMANSGTKSTGRAGAPTRPRIPSGLASGITGLATLGRNLPLNDEERPEWNRLRTLRKRGMMLSMAECDWLLEVMERMQR